MAIIIPEIVLLKIINGLNAHYWRDYQTELANDTPEESLLYNIFGGLQLDDFNYFEHFIKILDNHNKQHSRPMKINLGYSPERIKPPSVSLLLPNEEPIAEGVGIVNGVSVTDVANSKWREAHRYPYTVTYALLISTDNANELMLLYHYYKTILVAGMEQFELNDFMKVRISGKDHTMDMGILPTQFHHRTVDMTFMYTNEVWNVMEKDVATGITFSGDHGTPERVCDPASVFVNSLMFGSVLSAGSINIPVKDTIGISVGSLIGGEWIVPTASCLDSTITFNGGTTITTVASGATEDLTIRYANLTPIGTAVGSIITIPDPLVIPTDRIYQRFIHSGNEGTDGLGTTPFHEGDSLWRRLNGTDILAQPTIGTVMVMQENSIYLTVHSNVFGNNYRITGTDGGFYNPIDKKYYNATADTEVTRSVAFPNELGVCHIYSYLVKLDIDPSRSWTTWMTEGLTKTIGAFTGFYLPTVPEIVSFGNWGLKTPEFSYKDHVPFDWLSGLKLTSDTYLGSGTTQCMVAQAYGHISSTSKANSNKAFYIKPIDINALWG